MSEQTEGELHDAGAGPDDDEIVDAEIADDDDDGQDDEPDHGGEG